MPRLAIDKNFLNDYSKLEKSVQAKVKETIDKFAKETYVGLHLEKPQNSVDDRMRTIRIDQSWRGVALAPDSGDTYYLMKILPHDKAIEYAASHRLTVNQALGVVEVRDEAAIERFHPALDQATETNTKGLFANVSDADLARLGIDENTRTIARLLNSEAQLDAMENMIPEAQYNALYLLAGGLPFEEVWAEVARSAPQGPFDTGNVVKAMERTTDRVIFVDSNNEFERILEHPFAAWRVFLQTDERGLRMLADGQLALASLAGQTTPTAVLDLAVRQSDTPGRFRIEVVSSDAGEAASSVALDVDTLLTQREDLQLAVLASAVASRRVLPETERPVREIGQLLFTALLGTGEVAGQYRAATALAARREQRLRVALRIDAPAVAALPWEAMYDETAGAYVCRQDQFVRHLGVARPPAPLRVQSPLRILGVISAPRGLPTLDVEKEQENLTHALSRPVSQGLAEVHWITMATWENLHNMLLDGPWHVVHYIGHGDFDPARDEGSLALVQDNGRAHHVAGHRFVDLLRQASPMPRLVVLNSCESAQASVNDLFSSTAATLVRGGTSAVVAMQFAISDRAAIAFARGFYSAIAHGRGIDDAVSSGRVAILGTSDYTLEWLTPVLYLRGLDARLFAIS